MNNDVINFTYKQRDCKTNAKYQNKTNKEDVIEPIDDELKKKILNLYTDTKKTILFK
jgi:hypothetical protein